MKVLVSWPSTKHLCTSTSGTALSRVNCLKLLQERHSKGFLKRVRESMRTLLCSTIMLMGAVLTLGLSAHASTVSITFVGTHPGVNDAVDFVLPYQLSINGILTDA